MKLLQTSLTKGRICRWLSSSNVQSHKLNCSPRFITKQVKTGVITQCLTSLNTVASAYVAACLIGQTVALYLESGSWVFSSPRDQRSWPAGNLSPRLSVHLWAGATPVSWHDRNTHHFDSHLLLSPRCNWQWQNDEEWHGVNIYTTIPRDTVYSLCEG